MRPLTVLLVSSIFYFLEPLRVGYLIEWKEYFFAIFLRSSVILLGMREHVA